MKSLGRIGIIGGSGWLGSAIAQSLVTSGKVAPADLICSYRSAMPGPVSWRLTKDNAELASVSDVIILRTGRRWTSPRRTNSSFR